MTTALVAPTAIPRQRQAGSNAGLLRRVWQALRDWQDRRATAAILHSLDRRTLRDIGVEPSEIESIVFNGGDERRRRYVASWRRHAAAASRRRG